MTWRLSYKVIKCLIFFMNDIIWFFVCFLSFGLILLSNRNLNYSRTYRGNTLIHFTVWTCFIKPFTDHVHLCQTKKFYSTIYLYFVVVCGSGWNSLPEVGSHFWWCKVQCFWHLSLINTEINVTSSEKKWINLLIYFQWFEGQGQALGWEAVRTVEEQEGEVVWGAEGVGEAEEEGVRTQHHEVPDQGLRDSTQVLHHWPRQSSKSLNHVILN